VFDPFYTTKPVGKGTGLGLSICYGIVTEHGGTIRVRNLATRGASFTIELPYHPAVLARRGLSREPDVSVRAARVLLVDGDDSVAEAVAAMLGGRDHQVTLAKDGAAAQELVAHRTFDLIVLDMPSAELGGTLAFVEWLRAHQPALAKRMIWMVTVAPSNESLEQANPDGCPVLQKPFKAADLLLAVGALLSDSVQTAPVEG
jgi:two-component system NtrC family sensor kinase